MTRRQTVGKPPFPQLRTQLCSERSRYFERRKNRLSAVLRALPRYRETEKPPLSCVTGAPAIPRDGKTASQLCYGRSCDTERRKNRLSAVLRALPRYRETEKPSLSCATGTPAIPRDGKTASQLCYGHSRDTERRKNLFSPQSRIVPASSPAASPAVHPFLPDAPGKTPAPSARTWGPGWSGCVLPCPPKDARYPARCPE